MTIQTNQNDVIFVGHGSYTGGAATFPLPTAVDLYIMQTVGSALTDGPVTALVAGRPIDRLVLKQSKRGPGAVADLSSIAPVVYKGPCAAPDLVLHELGPELGLITAALPLGPHHVITVSTDTRLSRLLASEAVRNLIAANSKAGTRLRIFWAACTSIDGASAAGQGAAVYHNAKAIAFAVTDWALGNADSATARNAANAALDHALANPEDTAGALAAAHAADPRVDSLTSPIGAGHTG